MTTPSVIQVPTEILEIEVSGRLQWQHGELCYTVSELGVEAYVHYIERRVRVSVERWISKK
jgi:hypothetical protein